MWRRDKLKCDDSTAEMSNDTQLIAEVRCSGLSETKDFCFFSHLLLKQGSFLSRLSSPWPSNVEMVFQFEH
jgi:hypothetical protein